MSKTAGFSVKIVPTKPIQSLLVIPKLSLLIGNFNAPHEIFHLGAKKAGLHTAGLQELKRKKAEESQSKAKLVPWQRCCSLESYEELIPFGYVKIAMDNGPVERVDFPMNSMDEHGDFL